MIQNLEFIKKKEDYIFDKMEIVHQSKNQLNLTRMFDQIAEAKYIKDVKFD